MYKKLGAGEGRPAGRGGGGVGLYPYVAQIVPRHDCYLLYSHDVRVCKPHLSGYLQKKRGKTLVFSLPDMYGVREQSPMHARATGWGAGCGVGLLKVCNDVSDRRLAGF